VNLNSWNKMEHGNRYARILRILILWLRAENQFDILELSVLYAYEYYDCSTKKTTGIEAILSLSQNFEMLQCWYY
jgi:hypothetical protein